MNFSDYYNGIDVYIYQPNVFDFGCTFQVDESPGVTMVHLFMTIIDCSVNKQ